MNHISKQEIIHWMNQLAGKEIMTEDKLEKTMYEAMRLLREKGLDHFFDYMRKVSGAPVSNEWMRQLINKLQTPEGIHHLLQELASVRPDFELNSNLARSQEDKVNRKRQVDLG